MNDQERSLSATLIPESDEPDHTVPTTVESKADSPSNEHVYLSSQLTLPREIIFVTIICLAQFTNTAGLGQTLAIQHVIGDSLSLSRPGELNPAVLSWLTAGYSLTVGTFILIFGRFGDLFGYKRMVLIGFIWFAVFSMMAGLSVYANGNGRFVMFVFARVLMGIGPSITMPNALALLGATYPPNGTRKNIVFAIFAAAAPCGSITAAAFAGLFALAWWPWAFFSFAIILAATAVAGVYAIPDVPPKARGSLHGLRDVASQLDLLGGFVGVLSLILINFAWNQAPIVGWHEPYVYVALLIGLLLVPVFFYIELHVAQFPLLPLAALNADVAWVLACLACGWASFGIWFYYTFQTFELLRHGGAGPLLTVAYMCPEGISGAVASVVTGLLLGRLRPASVMTIALAAFLIGTILIATASPNQIYWGQTFFATMVISWGMDMSFPAATVILSNSLPREEQGVGASLVATIVNYSTSIGLGFAGTVEQQVGHYADGQTREALLTGFRGGYYMGIGFASFGLCLSVLFLLKGHLKTRGT